MSCRSEPQRNTYVCSDRTDETCHITCVNRLGGLCGLVDGYRVLPKAIGFLIGNFQKNVFCLYSHHCSRIVLAENRAANLGDDCGTWLCHCSIVTTLYHCLPTSSTSKQDQKKEQNLWHQNNTSAAQCRGRSKYDYVWNIEYIRI